MTEESQIPENLSVETPKATLRLPFVIGLVVLGLVLLTGAVYAGIQIGKKQTASPGKALVSNQDSQFPSDNTQTEAKPTTDPTANWKTYTNEKYGFSLKYPPLWQPEDATGFFKEGGIFSVLIVGDTQKQETEFYDGARLAVGLPLKTSKTIIEWVKEDYPAKNINDEPNIFSEESINGKIFQKVHTCGLGCYDYFNIISDGYVYRIMTFSGGPEKARHEVTLDQILSTFKFLD